MLLILGAILIILIIFIYIHTNSDQGDTQQFISQQDIIPIVIHKKITRKIKKKKINPINDICGYIDDDLASKYINSKNTKTKICGKKPQTAKEFANKFFKFRDFTEHNSSMHYDPVDKITDLRLSGALEEGSDLKIKDVYDQLTSGPDLYKNKCTRLPYFDHVMNDGYNFDFVTGLYGTGRTWNYYGDNEMNTGILDPGLSATQDGSNYFPALSSIIN